MAARNRPGATPSHDGILAEYARLGIRPISGGDGTDDAAAKAAADAKAAEEKAAAEAKAKAEADETAKLGEAGKKALDAEREARSAAEKAKKEADKELAALRKEKTDREEAERKAVEDKAKADGEWQRLADERETKLAESSAAAKSLGEERDALAAKVAAYEDRDRTRITNGIKDLPEDLAAFDPGDDVPLDQRLKWFDKAQEIAAKRATDPVAGVRRLPDPLRGDPKRDEEARKAQAVLARNF